MRNGFFASIILLSATVPSFAQDPRAKPAPDDPGLLIAPAVSAPNAPQAAPLVAVPLNTGPRAKPAQQETDIVIQPNEGQLPKPALDNPGLAGATTPPTVQSDEPVRHVPESPEGGFRIWGSIEYMHLWFKNSPDPSVRLALGVPGRPGFTPLFGGQPLDTADHGGARFTIGSMLPGSDDVGAEVNYFFLSSKNTGVSVPAPAAAVFPFINARTGALAAIPVAVPGLATDRETIAISQSLQGFEFNGLFTLRRGCDYHVDLLAGFRYLDLHENLLYESVQAGIPGGATPRFTATYLDQFNARNQFFAANLAARIETQRGKWFFSATGKLALGDMHEHLGISAASTLANGAPFFLTGVFPGQGVSAQRTNIGVYTRDQFAVAPEFTLKAGYDVSRWAKVYVGYNLLYMSEVIRPGDQVSALINGSNSPAFGNPPGALVGPAAPLLSFRGSEFWAQGVTFGVLFQY